MSFAGQLKQRCEIRTPLDPTGASAVDDWNNPIDIASNDIVTTNVPCFVYTRAGTEYTTAQRVLSTDEVMFDFLAAAPVTNASRIVYLGEVYTVQQVALVGGGHHKTVKAYQVEVTQ